MCVRISFLLELYFTIKETVSQRYYFVENPSKPVQIKNLSHISYGDISELGCPRNKQK
jgi:hypothetical protein